MLESQTCAWVFEENHCYWDTGCGRAYDLGDTTPGEDESYRFCPGCGKLISVKQKETKDEHHN